MIGLTKRRSRISVLQRSSSSNWEIQAVEMPNHSPLKYFRKFTSIPIASSSTQLLPTNSRTLNYKKRDKKNTEKSTNKEGSRIRCNRLHRIQRSQQ
ncbi:hypothetical protein AVEN_137254-1 [Araneus ventricosus]|uniref:Uncharacterized protein n=1 Tax=Araneus ventricosus TaxID=182803 RepID=A0A4Y2DS79_ARAVE|nr:hypothetical protein AVEN_137254-1 [Araneus ventricosus]